MGSIQCSKYLFNGWIVCVSIISSYLTISLSYAVESENQTQSTNSLQAWSLRLASTVSAEPSTIDQQNSSASPSVSQWGARQSISLGAPLGRLKNLELKGSVHLGITYEDRAWHALEPWASLSGAYSLSDHSRWVQGVVALIPTATASTSALGFQWVESIEAQLTPLWFVGSIAKLRYREEGAPDLAWHRSVIVSPFAGATLSEDCQLSAHLIFQNTESRWDPTEAVGVSGSYVEPDLSIQLAPESSLHLYSVVRMDGDPGWTDQSFGIHIEWLLH